MTAGDSLLIIGLGYSATAFVAAGAGGAASISATTQSADRPNPPGIRLVVFDGTARSPEVADAIRSADRILVSAPPDETGDPVLRHHATEIRSARASIVYLSTVGVYGDHRGGWVDETTTPRPVSRRSVQRVAAEDAWRHVADSAGVPVAILRLAGIYGPGRNALANLADGTARRIVKPGQVFNRIHLTDIATAIDAAFAARFDGPLNITDDEPGPPQDVVAFAASLLHVPAPPELPFGSAELSPMARLFYGENKRVRNDWLKALIGKALSYPTYREGLTALFTAGEGRRNP